MTLVHDVQRERVTAGLLRRLDDDGHERRLARGEVVGERRPQRGGEAAVREPQLGQPAASVRPDLAAEVRDADVERSHLAGRARFEGGRLETSGVGGVREGPVGPARVDLLTGDANGPRLLSRRRLRGGDGLDEHPVFRRHRSDPQVPPFRQVIGGVEREPCDAQPRPERLVPAGLRGACIAVRAEQVEVVERRFDVPRRPLAPDGDVHQPREGDGVAAS